MASFGWAIEQLKAGKRVSRSGWNGKGMFIFLMPGHPDGVPADATLAKAMGIEEGTMVNILPSITMRTANGDLCPGWLSSQTDTQADDWSIVDR